jgi:hypothetical protein
LVGTLSKVTAGRNCTDWRLAALGLIAWPVMAGVNMLIAGAGLLVIHHGRCRYCCRIYRHFMACISLIAVVAAGALLIRKYWEPISAFIGGVAEGFKAALAPVAAAFEPMKPVFDWFSEKIKAVYNWFMDLLEPVKSTQAELQNGGRNR